jgi:uncharacterized membrane protein YphA (DoxX/SURF4 family)
MQNTQLDKAWWAMRLTYGLVPIVAGGDKFTNLLTDWRKYLSPLATRVVPVSPSSFMRGVGIIEVVAGALVLNRRTTRFGAYLVGAWLGAIALNLFTKRSHYDVAVRDLVMGVGALTLAKLTEARTESTVVDKEEPLMHSVEPPPRGPSNEQHISV